MLFLLHLGPTIISKLRPDLKKKYEGIFGEDDTRVLDYIYHCNAQSPRYSFDSVVVRVLSFKIHIIIKLPKW